MQLDDPARGFTFKDDGPLDHRFNPLHGRPASALLRTLSQADLADLLVENADEPYADAIARALHGQSIDTTVRLADGVRRALAETVPAANLPQETRKALQRTFQALRIAVNDEFRALDQFLAHLPDCLKPGGRVAILSFHSGEDRRVKKAFQAGHRDGVYARVAPDPIRPSADERRANRLARPAPNCGGPSKPHARKGEVGKNPVFHTKAGFFIWYAAEKITFSVTRHKLAGIGNWNMNGSLTLKIFLSISLGLHLLFFSMSSLLFPDFKVNRLQNLNIEASLLPFISETKANPPHVTQEGKNPIHQERAELREEKKEEPVFKEEREPDSPPAREGEKVNPTRNPSPVTLESVKWETGDKREERIIVASRTNSFPITGSSEKMEMAMKNPSLSDGEILFAQPKYAKNPKPNYPPEARQKGYEGEVILKVEVLADGRVGQIEVKNSSGFEMLDHSAPTTVKQWKFVPAKKGEKNIPQWVNTPIKFQLQ